MVCVELEAELWVGDDASPALADNKGVRDRGRQRRKAEEDLLEHVVRQVGGAAVTDARPVLRF